MSEENIDPRYLKWDYFHCWSVPIYHLHRSYPNRQGYYNVTRSIASTIPTAILHWRDMIREDVLSVGNAGIETDAPLPLAVFCVCVTTIGIDTLARVGISNVCIAEERCVVDSGVIVDGPSTVWLLWKELVENDPNVESTWKTHVAVEQPRAEYTSWNPTSLIAEY